MALAYMFDPLLAFDTIKHSYPCEMFYLNVLTER